MIGTMNIIMVVMISAAIITIITIKMIISKTGMIIIQFVTLEMMIITKVKINSQ